MELPYNFTNDTVLDADELQATLETLRDGFGQIRNANIVANAGIDKSKLAHPGALSRSTFLLVPTTSNASLDTGADAGFTLPAAHQTKHRSHVRLAAGQLAALCEIQLMVEESVIGGATLPEIQILIDGVLFMGQAVTIAATATVNRYRFGYANSIANPGYPLADDSIIEYQLRRDGVGAPTIRQVSATEHIKAEHVAM